MRKDRFELLGISDPDLQQAYADYLALDYYGDKAILQQKVCERFTVLAISHYQKALTVFVCKKMHGKNRIFVEDIIQNVTLAFFQKVRANIGNPEQVITKNLKGLLYAIAVHKISEHFRYRVKFESHLIEGGGDEPYEDSLFEHFIEREFDEYQRQSYYNSIVRDFKIGTLTQQILYYRLVKQESYPYISHRLGITVDYAQKAIRRIIDRLENKS